MQLPIKRALISVSDKSGLNALVSFLAKNDVEILSTGGTANYIRELGVSVTEISDYTEFPEIMDGRVKTLHPKVHGGLLACLDNETHVEQMAENAIDSIDLVVVNLYPFEEQVASRANDNTVIENIDIGGPSMIRSAAKNYFFKTIVVDPDDYALLVTELKNHDMETSIDFRKDCARKAFARTSSYDQAISSWFMETVDSTDSVNMPEKISFSGILKTALRYGENPHQKAAFYKNTSSACFGIAAAKQLHGKALSYNNINDADAALLLVSEFDTPSCAIIKHANPCGVASADSILNAYNNALASDPVSAFGSIISFNDTVDVKAAEALSKLFVEAIIAPSYESEALMILQKKKNIRLLEVDVAACRENSHEKKVKSVSGGFLVQENDFKHIVAKDLNVVTKRAPSKAEISDLLFANTVCKHVKSNAIVLVKNKATIAVGAGQMSRVDSVKIATLKAAENKENSKRANGSVLASDAFFPFADGIEQAIKAGVTAVIQPGGSVRDEEVIDAANNYDIAMVFTGTRHFNH